MKTLLLAFSFFFMIAMVHGQSQRGSFSTAQNVKLSAENVTLYPNPVQDILRISVSTDAPGLLHVNLYNNLGKLVTAQDYLLEEGQNVFVLDVKAFDLQPGAYFVDISSTGSRLTRKIMVR